MSILQKTLLISMVVALAACATKSRQELEALVQNQAAELMGRLQTVEPLSLTGEQAVAIALENNLQLTIERKEADIRNAFNAVSIFELLPDLRGSMLYHNQEQPRSGRSVSSTTGNVSLQSSISSDEENWSSKVELAWSSADFGIAYMKRYQGKIDKHIRALAVQRSTDDLVKQTLSLYRQAYAYQELQKRYAAPADELKKMLQVAEELAERRQQARGYMSQYQRQLIDGYRQLITALGNAHDAEYRLKTLLDIPLLQPLVLAEPPPVLSVDALASFGFEDLLLVSLLNRPDVWQVLYESEIDVAAQRMEVIRALPNVTASYGLAKDSNSLIDDSEWPEFDASVGMGVFRLFNAWKKVRLARKLDSLTPLKVSAVMSGTALQLKIAEAELANKGRLYCASLDYQRMEEREREYVERSQESGGSNRFDQVLSDIGVLLAEYHYVLQSAELEQARFLYLQSLGLPLERLFVGDTAKQGSDVGDAGLFIPDEALREQWASQLANVGFSVPQLGGPLKGDYGCE